MSQNSDKVGKITQQISEQGLPIIDRLLDKLTGMNTSITYSFEKFEIDMPNVHGPKGQQMGGGKLSINGNFTISTELHNNTNKRNEDNAAEYKNSIDNSGSDSNLE
ncbi:MAG: hypothetical protein H0U27_05630 [Nitrosopumilus sp.]|nr:hypothetical protein [Nitrosopumilus sp.]